MTDTHPDYGTLIWSSAGRSAKPDWIEVYEGDEDSHAPWTALLRMPGGYSPYAAHGSTRDEAVDRLYAAMGEQEVTRG